MKFSISRFTSVSDLRPRHETMSWQTLATLLSEPQEAPCARQSCLGSNCPYKRGACWSPATFTEATPSSPRAAATLSLLVFGVDRLTDDEIDEIRSRLDGLQYLMHSTHSDLPDSRSLRIVIALSRSISADVWKSFFHNALRRLVPSADPACADAGRLYFLPSFPRDGSYFTQVNEGLPLDVDSLLVRRDPVNPDPASNY